MQVFKPVALQEAFGQFTIIENAFAVRAQQYYSAMRSRRICAYIAKTTVCGDKHPFFVLELPPKLRVFETAPPLIHYRRDVIPRSGENLTDPRRKIFVKLQSRKHLCHHRVVGRFRGEAQGGFHVLAGELGKFRK